jgi:hydrogenase expression/formation protein HypD
MSQAAFSDPKTARSILDKIAHVAQSLTTVRIMEVCGTHTMEIGRLGLRALLPKNIELLSGPGCPVCVTSGGYIDAAAKIAIESNVRIVTFGDMVRVPGSTTSLDKAKSTGAIVEVVTSPLQAIDIAKAHPHDQVVFLAVGFETTAPATAKTIDIAKSEKITNISFLISHKIVPPALEILVNDTALGLSGFLLPGHVSSIIGLQPYQFLAQRNLPSVVTGFEPLDILTSVFMICDMLSHKKAAVLNTYSRIVREYGNPLARDIVDKVFDIGDAMWRGIGVLPKSGLVCKKEYADFDAATRFKLSFDNSDSPMPENCSCGDVLKGRIKPNQCPLFGTTCTPENPVGPCMVSSEGSCAAYFRYGA